MIKMLKLVNGDEIIGVVSEATKMYAVDPDKVVVKKPALLGLVPTQNGQPQMGLADYLMMSDDSEITIGLDKILFMHNPKAGLRNAYNQMFGSGLVVPDAGSLIKP